MGRLISDVLDFTRGELAGGIPITRSPVDLSVIARRIIDEVRTAHPNRRIELQVPATMTGSWDPARLEQVISNLLGNALSHSERDPVRVTLEIRGEMARLAVTNPGTIPPDISKLLFEPFRKGSNSAQGLGLGLYIVREIVRSHLGTVELDTAAVADEITFVVTLPR